MSMWPKWYTPPARLKTPVDEMLRTVADYYGVSVAVLKGASKQKHLVMGRSVIAMILRERGLSYPHIARLLGRRDHSTIMHLVATFENRVKYNPEMGVLYRDIMLPESKAEALAA